jgi:hypothetical protein
MEVGKMSKFSSAMLPDKISIVLGIVLFLSPWLFGFASVQDAALSAHIVGAIIFVIAISEVVAFKIWEEWIGIAAGVWLLFAPFVLGFNTHVEALATHVMIGLAAILFAVWSMSDHGSGRMTSSG